MAGTEFGEDLGSDDIAKALYRLAVVYGQPFGSDRDMLRVLAQEWLEALSDIPPKLFQQAISDWIATEKKWPRPSDIREKARPRVSAAAVRAGSGANIHERRLSPTPEMLRFPFVRSGLRTHPQWANYLDSIHPTAEHNYFVQAELAEDGLTLEVPNEFRREWITTRLGAGMASFFGKPVHVRVNNRRPYAYLPLSGEA